MYISANVAVARTNSARQSDEYIGEHIIFPAIMKEIMSCICIAADTGKGEAIYYLHNNLLPEYSTRAFHIACTFMEDKMTALSYRIVKCDEDNYKFIWLSE